MAASQSAGQAEIALRAGAGLAEGPLWDPDRKAVWWVDIFGGTINRLDHATLANTSFSGGDMVTALALRNGGRSLLVAQRGGFGVFDPDDGSVEMVATVKEVHPANRFNDGKVDSRGRFWAGTMDNSAAPGLGSLYRLGADWKHELMVPAVTISNGIDWSPDDSLMYYVDTPTQRVDQFDYDAETGEVSNRRPFAELPRSEGTPDGLTVDAEGSLWLAMFGGSVVYRYDRQGRRTGALALPTPSVTSCTFAGPGLDELLHHHRLSGK